MSWMRQLLDWQREAADPGDFLENLRFDLGTAEIFVFTPKGDVVTLPQGSTPGRLRLRVHTEVGNRCIGSRVNGRLVALERKLESGDVVEIFTSKAEGAGPSHDWLSFAASPRAKTKIRQWFAKERREEAIEAGKEAITREARRTGMPLQRLVSADAMGALARELHHPDPAGLYAAVGEGHTSAQHVVQRLVALLGGVEEAEEELAERSTPSTIQRRRTTGDAGVVVAGDRRRPHRASTRSSRAAARPCPATTSSASSPAAAGSRCTAPTAPTPTTCTTAPSGSSTSSGSVSPGSVFLVAIQVEALDRHRLLSDITKVLADEKVNILSAR
jgi:GTP pyrophosphokinase